MSNAQDASQTQAERRPLLGSSANDSNYSATAGSGSGTSTPKLFNSKATVKKTIKKAKRKSYWSYYVPILNWLPKYTPRLLFGDIVAGLTVSIAEA